MIAKIWTGIVSATPSASTAVISVSHSVRHPKYGKYMRRVRKYPAQDDLNCKVGETVRIVEIPRISKTKSKKVIAVLSGSEVIRSIEK